MADPDGDAIAELHGMPIGWERLCRDLAEVAYQIEHARVCAAWMDRQGFEHFWTGTREAFRRAAAVREQLPDDGVPTA